MKFLVAALLMGFLWGGYEALTNYQYQNRVDSYWNLSDRSSTLTQKSMYLDQYVAALERANLAGTYNAIWLKTPDKSYDENMVALKSLQGRMHQIAGMDETSFAYQTAMQQITAQEMGEAVHLTGTFEGCWYLRNHPLLWGWIDICIWGSIVATAFTGLFLLISRS